MNYASTSLSLTDFSIFAFHTRSSDSGITISPILITDPHLSVQYPRAHCHTTPNQDKSEYRPLPVFDVVDWTDQMYRGNTAKVSTWRTNPRSERRSTGHVHAIKIETKQVFPAAKRLKAKGEPANEMSVHVIPLHAFLDLGLALNADSGLLPFIAEISEYELAGESVGCCWRLWKAHTTDWIQMMPTATKGSKVHTTTCFIPAVALERGKIEKRRERSHIWRTLILIKAANRNLDMRVGV
jgi:hypothetical protein